MGHAVIDSSFLHMLIFLYIKLLTLYIHAVNKGFKYKRSNVNVIQQTDLSCVRSTSHFERLLVYSKRGLNKYP